MNLRSLRNVRKVSKRKLFLNVLFVGFIVMVIFLYQVCVDNTEEITLQYCMKSQEMGSKMLKEFLLPEHKTALISPKLISSREQKINIAVYVPSTPTGLANRQAIRETWGSVDQLNPIFVIGRPSSENFSVELQREILEFGDILLEDFLDTYDNLTLKTGFAMKHFIQNQSNNSLFFKVDDDVMLNVENLYESLGRAPKDALMGRISSQIRPVKDYKSKWFMPDCIFFDEFYPDYLQGAGYLIPGKSKILIRLKQTPFNFSFSMSRTFYQFNLHRGSKNELFQHRRCFMDRNYC